MPHVVLSYNQELAIPCHDLFDKIEAVINRMDASAGACKSRALPVAIYKYEHIKVDVYLLSKPHRTADFSQQLLNELQVLIARQLPPACFLSLELHYSSDLYVTGVAGEMVGQDLE